MNERIKSLLDAVDEIQIKAREVESMAQLVELAADKEEIEGMNGTMCDQCGPYRAISDYLHKLAGDLIELDEALDEIRNKAA